MCDGETYLELELWSVTFAFLYEAIDEIRGFFRKYHYYQFKIPIKLIA